MDAIESVVDPLRDFAKDSVRLVKRCHKPDRKEFTKVAFRTTIGFVIMGFVGFFRRVHESGVSDHDRIRYYGIRWVLRQAHLHPHQQHHHRI
ncbi:uncharacterized protein A4U43_C04F18610 [Asparagus officinalis]|uniref:Protein transport protein Sec61 subunit gamma n=1 Tax=Asparagus officinalis TaxID=4686 RepID=A0A5P1F785_ASPOF|nr:uncharacterized protein A4U43_C04F18610 [Asparagus officinalis]